jgi:large subunit ribosomal protein L21e
MVDRVGGSRRKTRYKLKKNVSEKGKISLRKYLQKFNIGDSVFLSAEPAVQNGMYHPRFHGKHGIVTKIVGTCYEVAIKDFTKAKIVVVHPVHLLKG